MDCPLEWVSVGRIASLLGGHRTEKQGSREAGGVHRGPGTIRSDLQGEGIKRTGKNPTAGK